MALGVPDVCLAGLRGWGRMSSGLNEFPEILTTVSLLGASCFEGHGIGRVLRLLRISRTARPGF